LEAITFSSILVLTKNVTGLKNIISKLVAVPVTHKKTSHKLSTCSCILKRTFQRKLEFKYWNGQNYEINPFWMVFVNIYIHFRTWTRIRIGPLALRILIRQKLRPNPQHWINYLTSSIRWGPIASAGGIASLSVLADGAAASPVLLQCNQNSVLRIRICIGPAFDWLPGSESAFGIMNADPKHCQN
jgi:hypothetical protein